MRKSIQAILLLSLADAGAWGSSAEKAIWACRTLNPDARPIIHLVEWGSRSYIRFTHMRFSAVHEVEEEREGWYWNNTGDGYYRYGILVEPDGRAWLHDFSDTDAEGLSSPLDELRCSQGS